MLVSDDFAIFWKTPSVRYLVLSNLFTILLGLVFGWSALYLMWIYWAQSIIIGFFHFLKLIRFGYSLPERVSESIFFAFHYGSFHFVYFCFLMVFSEASMSVIANTQGLQIMFVETLTNLSLFFIAVASLTFSHWISYMQYKPTNEGPDFFEPYARIFPMHLTIILGGMFVFMFSDQVVWIGNALFLIIFGVLKTLADAGAHIAKHKSAIVFCKKIS